MIADPATIASSDTASLETTNEETTNVETANEETTNEPHLYLVQPELPQSEPQPELTPDELEPTEPETAQTVSLRSYQTDCVKSVRWQWHRKNEDRVRATLAVLATGTGKTVIMAEIARRALDEGHAVLWLAHRDELIRQGAKALGRMGIHAIIEKALERALPSFGVLSHCVVASVQTLQKERLEQWPPDAFSLIIVDEAHHTPAQSYKAILDYFERARIVGFTATADRLDGKNVGRVYESLAYEYTLLHAIRDPEGPWLVPLEVVPIRTDPPINLKNIRITAGDLNNADLEKELIENMDNIVNESKPALAGRRTIAFTPDIKSAHAMAEAFKMVGVRATYIASCDVHGRPISIKTRDAIADQFRRGLYDVVVNPMVWTEGVDLPFVDCILNARPTKSRALFSQMVGRGTRLYPGKACCRIVDLACIGHELISPVDLFDDSEHSDEVVARARELVKEGKQPDPLLALEFAEEERELELQRRIQLRERAPRAQLQAYDPLGALQLIGFNRKDSQSSWFLVKPASERDKAFLNKIYNKKRQVVDVDSLGYYEAKQLKKKTLDRMNKGLCSVNQIALLVAKGMPQHEAVNVRFSEVNEVLQALEGSGAGGRGMESRR